MAKRSQPKPRRSRASSDRKSAGSSGRSSAAASARTGRQARRADAEVEAFIADLDHPLKDALLRVRGLILKSSPAVREGIKWNTPSFRTGEWFATLQIRGAGRPPRPREAPSLLVVLHQGAKSSDAIRVDDPTGLLEWRGKDRAIAEYREGDALTPWLRALSTIVTAWVAGLKDSDSPPKAES